MRLTPDQNVLLTNIRDEHVGDIQHLLDDAGIATDRVSAIRRRSVACPALPLCGLATAEAERVLPGILSELEQRGHGADDVIIRVSGCPNSCSRPETAEIGLIGKGNNQYSLHVGGSGFGRMGLEVISPVKLPEVASVLGRLLSGWKADRVQDERFGDWALRCGVDELRGLLTQSGAEAKHDLTVEAVVQ